MSKEKDDIMNEHYENDADKQKALLALKEELNAEEAFDTDADEGLAQFDHDNFNQTVSSLNAQLAKQTGKNKRKRKTAGTQPYVYIAVITILLLAVITYIVIKRLYP